jgi:hypothetical protein
VSWFNAIALRAIVVGLIGGADVGAVAGAPLPGYGNAFGALFGAIAGIPIGLACARAAALNLSTSAGPAFARPARIGSAVLSVAVALPSVFIVSPVGALILVLTAY